MSYEIILSNGNTLTTIPDEALDYSTSLILLGRDYAGYGTIVADNFVRLMENFSNGTAPVNPLVGQLWYDDTNLWICTAVNPIVWAALALQSFVLDQASNTLPIMDSVATIGISLKYARADHIHPTDTTRAPLDSPLLTGNARSNVTPVADDNSNKIATTAYVIGQVTNMPPIMDSVATIGISLKYARADHIHPTDTTRAPLFSPVLTGDPRSVTPARGDNDTSIATTAFVQDQIAALMKTNFNNVFVGTIIAYGYDPAGGIPTGWLLCAGQSVSRAQYPVLFARIYGTWGADDASTFKLPDLLGRTLFGYLGQSSGRIDAAILGNTVGQVGGHYMSQNHTHPAGDTTHSHTVNDPRHAHAPDTTDGNETIANYVNLCDNWRGDGQMLGGVPGVKYVTSSPRTEYAYTGITINAASAGGAPGAYGAGYSQNIPPAAVVAYLIFAGI